MHRLLELSNLHSKHVHSRTMPMSQEVTWGRAPGLQEHLLLPTKLHIMIGISVKRSPAICNKSTYKATKESSLTQVFHTQATIHQLGN